MSSAFIDFYINKLFLIIQQKKSAQTYINMSYTISQFLRI